MPTQAERLAALAQKRQALLEDLGGAETLSVIRLDLVTLYLQLGMQADYLIEDLQRTGPMTGPLPTKGRARAALRTWIALVDRQTRLGLELGLVRVAKPVNPLDAVRDAVREVNPT